MIKIFFISSFLFFFGCSHFQKEIVQDNSTKNSVVAHRGAFKKNNFPENSIASLHEAKRLKCIGAEFDVRMTLDDSLIINHDPKFNELEIEQNNYSDLAKFKLSNGEILPTLRNYILEGLKNNNYTKLVLEIKPSEISKERGKIIAEKVIRLIKELNAQPMVDYISFDYDILKKLIEIDSTVSTQYLEGDKSPEEILADKISGIDYHYSVYQKHPEWIINAKKYNLILNVWTVNEEKDLLWALKNNFDFITTNEPELLFRLINK